MPVSTNIVRVMETIDSETEARRQNPTAPTPVSTDVQNKAKAAIFAGRPSNAWTDYMTLFTAGNTTDLARLTATTDTDADREKARVYLVSNGVCGINTTGSLIKNVTTRLD
jgi:hypothetical protein